MVCVGAGGAGVTAAVTAAASGLRVLIVSKDPIGHGNTRIALGGLASAGIVDEDSPGNLYDDMLAGGEHINNPSLARAVAWDSRLAPGIAEAQGIVFRRDAAGVISRSVVARPGGHNYHRSVRAIGKGVAMGQGLRAAIARSGVDVLEEAITITLLRNGESVVGLVAWDVAAGRPVVVRSKAVVLASGGLGWLYYPHTDCTKSSTGDGYAMALAAGANLVDMEQVQFVPFACTRPASMVGLLLGEPSWAGPGGRLLDTRGREVGTGIHRLTRAQVSKMIGVAVEEGRGTPQGGLLLDLHPNLSLPQGQALWDRLKADGYLDVAKRAYGPKAYTWEDPWEVAPSAHFQMGGVRIDEHGQTAVPGLLAAGEVAGGVHGANRLGGVALTEIFAFGRRAGMAATRRATSVGQSPLPADQVEDALSGATGLLGASGEHRPITLVCRLQRAMWRGAGVVRSEAGISAALDEVRLLRRQSASLSVGSEPRYNFELVDAIELRHMLSTAETVLASAMLRRESRGAHVRSDYPDRDDPKWRANIVARAEGSRIDLVVEPVAVDLGGG